jgi:hypothetical protein
MIRNFFSSLPTLLVACKFRVCDPSSLRIPVMRPEFVSSERDDGRPSAENIIGRSPVAGMSYRTGEPGRTPNTEGPLICGLAGAGGVKGEGSSGGLVTSMFPACKDDRSKLTEKREAMVKRLAVFMSGSSIKFN